MRGGTKEALGIAPIAYYDPVDFIFQLFGSRAEDSQQGHAFSEALLYENF
jgi:hypothetical protein